VKETVSEVRIQAPEYASLPSWGYAAFSSAALSRYSTGTIAEPRPNGPGLCWPLEWALAAFFHELTVAAEVAEERQVPIP
jgi:hypothetical protein